VPINAFVQRLERVTEAILNDCNNDYGEVEPKTPAATLFRAVKRVMSEESLSPRPPPTWYDVLAKMKQANAESTRLDPEGTGV
jgi:hypothetical protein